MKRIKQIFDGEYGCEERTADEKAKVLVILEDETGQESSLSVEDDWLRAPGVEEAPRGRRTSLKSKEYGGKQDNTKNPGRPSGEKHRISCGFSLMSYISSECNCQY